LILALEGVADQFEDERARRSVSDAQPLAPRRSATVALGHRRLVGKALPALRCDVDAGRVAWQRPVVSAAIQPRATIKLDRLSRNAAFLLTLWESGVRSDAGELGAVVERHQEADTIRAPG
jgi:hypothetical protein